MAKNVKLAYYDSIDYDVRDFVKKDSEYYDEPWMALFSWLYYDSGLYHILFYDCTSKEDISRVYREAYRLFFNKRHSVIDSLKDNLRYVLSERLGLDACGEVKTLREIGDELGVSGSKATNLYNNAVKLIAYKNHYCYLEGMLFDEEGLNEYLQSKNKDVDVRLYSFKFSDEMEYKVARHLICAGIHSFAQLRDVIFEKCNGCPSTEEEVVGALMHIRHIDVNYAEYIISVMKGIGILELMLNREV